METIKTFKFGAFDSRIAISRELPALDHILFDAKSEGSIPKFIIICDENTLPIAKKITGNTEIPFCVLKSGETSKTWASIETILMAAAAGGLGRDGLFIGIGGGVIGDLTAFAASIYMRGCKAALVSTTLLGMVDASLGGKTGIDLFGMKNLAGTFYPASLVYMPVETLASLPPPEWKSGMAELIKTAIIDGGDFFNLAASLTSDFSDDAFTSSFPQSFINTLLAGDAEKITECITRAVTVKGSIVEADPKETTGMRACLNLGHTFGHALESSAGLGTISHGEAVAWGIARSCELGIACALTSAKRAAEITGLLGSFGYELTAPHPLMGSEEIFLKALSGDKKKKAGKTVFIVPNENGVCSYVTDQQAILKKIITGAAL
ncbi:MAG: 3-dehydroquinate synthase [Treponema sp.]|jgi:3-dehydroquinate synthase|nr:3-dehydroquinate synthase [Treponema sp.]